MLRRRILAAATATILALGMSVGGAGAAFANPVTPDPIAGVTLTDENGLTCNGAGYQKPGAMDASSGTYSDEWGSASWNGSSITWTLNEGWDVDFCVKGASWVAEVDTTVFSGTTYDFTGQVGHEISHVGFIVRETPPPASVTPGFTTTDQQCEDGVLLVGGSITLDTQDGAISYEVTDADGNVQNDLTDLPPGTYTVTPSATGEATLDLDGYDSTATIGAFEGDCELPPLGTASVAFTHTAPTCDLAQTVEVNVVSTANATLDSTDTSVPGQVTFVFIADEGSVFSESEPPVFDGPGSEPTVLSADISDDFTQLTVVIQVLPADEELCEGVDPVEVNAAIEFSYDCFVGGSITLTGDSGVIWSLDGVATDQRVWTELPLDFTGEFTASLDPERPELFFSENSVTSATVTFVEPFPCDLDTLPLVEPSVTSTQATCDASGSYTLSNTEGVQWVVNGQNANPGTYAAAPGSTVSIEAVALDGFGFGFETQTEWELEFAAAPTNCDDLDLPTLAMTGASGMVGSLGIVALLITLTGIGVVATRRRVEV